MSLSAGGIGSGLDVDGIISQLMQLEQRPLQQLQRREESHKETLSAFSKVKGAMSDFQSAVNALDEPAKFSATRARTGETAGFSASSDSDAAAGAYDIRVDQLAQTQRVATQAGGGGFEPGDGPGSLTVTFGTLNDGIFTEDASRTATLDFAGGSLEELRDAINSDDSLGVSASIINNGNEQQLVLRGADSGQEQAFSLSGTGSLNALTYDPAATTESTDPVYTLQQAQNAEINIDGIDVTRSSNTLDDVIDGVTLELEQETTAAASLSVSQDNGPARAAVSGFVDAYNKMYDTLQQLSRYNPETDEAGVLNGDSTVRRIQTQMRSMLGGSFEGTGEISLLSQVGVEFDRNGKLTLDSARLNAALENPDQDVAAFFSGRDDTPGVAEQLNTRLEGYLQSGGILDGRTDSINASIERIESQRENLLRRLERTEQRYRDQYAALDSMIAEMNQTSNYLAQQLAGLQRN